MNFPEREIASGPRSFVSEGEIEERKRRKQEEWERTRKPDDPLEAPEEVYDHRSLYEKLQEQKMKKESDYEEEHKLKNMIRGLDDDEAAFLDQIDRSKMESECKKQQEEADALAEFHRSIENVSQEEKDKKLQDFKKTLWKRSPSTSESDPSPSTTNKSSRSGQAALLAGVVKRKATSSEDEPKTKKQDEGIKSGQVETVKCLGILPGIGNYGSDSSDSENSSDSDNFDCDSMLDPAPLISRVARPTNESKQVSQ